MEQEGSWLIVRFPDPQRVASWAIVGGGIRNASAVAWHQADDEILVPDLDPARYLEEKLRERGLENAVGMLTGRNLSSFTSVERGSVRCVATVGLSNALRAGDPPGTYPRIGTINLLVSVGVPLTDDALLETLALASEARTLALLESGIPSRVSGLPATGTGTDCIVIAAPEGREKTSYAGKHTELGHLVGSAVVAAVRDGVERWKLAHPDLLELLPPGAPLRFAGGGEGQPCSSS